MKVFFALAIFISQISLNFLEAKQNPPCHSSINGDLFLPPLQTAKQATACIPPELQNLPYAVYPNSPEYNTLRLNVNKRFVYFPKAIFEPVTTQQIQFVVSILKKYSLRFAIRSGGHCLEPGSLSSDYIIDLRNFNTITPDIANQQVYIGAGCHIEQVIQTLGQINFAIPTGTCPTVGITGLTLGGGIGFLSRNFGLTCDSVVSITLLNANAEIIEVNQNSFPDLFWALLGGGNGSYGIVLGFTFKMYFIPVVTFYELTWNWDPELFACLMPVWQKWTLTLPDTITSVFTLHHENKTCSTPANTPVVNIMISGIKVGPEPFDEWVKAFERFSPQVKLVQDTYLNTAPLWEDKVPAPFFKGKSKIMMKPLPKKVINNIKHFFDKVNKADPKFIVTFNFERFGGKIPDFETAFFPRKAFGWWEQIYYWNLQKQNAQVISIANRYYEQIPHGVSKFCYANFVDYDLGKKYLKAYYGTHVNRLIEIKNKYDPTNLFHWKQSIPLERP